MDWITSLFKGMNAKDWGSILGGVGGAYGAYKQGKVADDMYKLQLGDYNDEKDRQKKTQSNIDSASRNLGVDHRYDTPRLALN